MFYNNCPSFYIFIRDFAARLRIAIIKVIIKKENFSDETKYVWKMTQVMDHTNTDCTFQLHTWYTTKDIKKNLLKLVAIL